ncbi:hypothetical protein J3T65_05365 [Staphylococcus simiae]|uniref:DUF6414 family protein n=1 Tax=Staphylococcus simiae TaxID=308354 RepID=UPI001A96748C|nr:hypothetical protein [Staphylococcus simiae]MBO1199086.1 hypothetical protein [Staphylococcus simiae]MBO1201206.1 hypothetical protein [Staphylococcus simiae]MBO1203355.1 hypothetical protein [Staphylococcus simiae]MBO1210882.1 hypothetical protein [Staphylococcus simiae]MBO1229524.1 hypothetical protein [Staphylococcus simiae]
MKDFLYLDTDAISSISAQLFEGKILEISDEKMKQTGDNIIDNYGSDEKRSTSAKFGTSGTNISGNVENSTFESKSIEFLNNETFKMGIKKAYDDYLYNKVYEELESKKEIHNIANGNQFDFVDINGKFTVLDINTSSKIFDTELLRQMSFMSNSFILPDIETLNNKYKAATKYLEHPGSKKLPKDFKDKKELEEFYETFEGLSFLKTFNEMSKHLSTIFGNKIILYRGNTILIGDRSCLRIPGETLSLANIVNIEGFGRKITETTTLSSVTDFQKMDFDDEDFLSKGTQGILMIFLTSVLGLKEKDTFDIFQPIGLEYSKVSR